MADSAETLKETNGAHSDFIQDLFVAYSAALRGYFRRRVNNEADVSELVQEVYVRLMHQNTGGKLYLAPRSYLFRTAANLVKDHHRRNASHLAERHVEFQDEFAETSEASAEAFLESKQLSQILKEAISELDPKSRQVFLLRCIHGLSYREIQTRTGIPLRSIERYMSQALAYCWAKVEKHL